MIAVLQQRKALLGSDGLPERRPPQVLLTITRSLQKLLPKITAQVGAPDIQIAWPQVENILRSTDPWTTSMALPPIRQAAYKRRMRTSFS